MKQRTVGRIHPAKRQDIGDLITHIPIPSAELQDLNPFLVLAHHGPQVFLPGNHGLPFDAHPHRGFETVTFILEGELAHIDSAGHQSLVHTGGVQWMTAGSGVIHNEVVTPEFRKNGGKLEILQLWVNLPRKLKMARPAYVGLQRSDIPQIPYDGGRSLVHLVSGSFGQTVGPIASLTGVTLMYASMEPGAQLTLPAPADRRVFFYVVKGDISVSGQTLTTNALVEFRNDGDEITMIAKSSTIILFAHAAPIDEPIVARGPFVMNSVEEINEAIRAYQAGNFDTEPNLS